MDLLAQTYLSDILHIVSQMLLVPAIIALLALIVYAAWCLGSIVVEAVTERRHFKVVMPDFLELIVGAAPEALPAVVAESGLLGKQKRVLLTLWEHRGLPVEAHVALAKRLIEEQDAYRNAILQRTQSVSKVAPMLGLMGTLIPLGPGIVSLGQGDTLTLSSSLLVAFDTTVAGLVVAVVTFLITKVRRRWYDDYMTALEASVTAVLEKVDDLRKQGTLGTVALAGAQGEGRGTRAGFVPLAVPAASAARQGQQGQQGGSGFAPRADAGPSAHHEAVE